MVVATFYAVLFTAVGKLCIAESHSFIRSMFFSVETLVRSPSLPRSPRAVSTRPLRPHAR